jgi:hypothetical protein
MNKINQFLDAIEDHFQHLDQRTNWPLNGAQIDSYFDAAEALEIYYRFIQINEKLSPKEIAELMPPIDMLRLSLTHNLIVGLKVASKYNIEDISFEKRIHYIKSIFEVMEHMTNGDIFCLDHKNLILNAQNISEKINQVNFNTAIEKDVQKQIANTIVTLNHYCYSLFYDVFMSAGFFIHGPYPTDSKFGKNSVLLIRDYHNLKPNIWPNEKSPYQKISMLLIYKNLDYKIDFENSQITETSIPDKLIAYSIIADGKEISLEKIKELEQLFDQLSIDQTKFIESLSDFDKIRKGSEICYTFFDKLRSQTTGSDFLPRVEMNIKEFGDQFIRTHNLNKKKSAEHWKKLFDPRNNYF